MWARASRSRSLVMACKTGNSTKDTKHHEGKCIRAFPRAASCPSWLMQSCRRSTETRPVLFQNATVHDHENAGPPRFLRRLFVDHRFLHPDGGHRQPDRLVDDSLHILRPAENIDDIDLLRNVEQRRIRL